MRIGELAQRTGVSTRSLRYYEQHGLLESERTPGGHREYAAWAVDRVIRIQTLYAAGLNSDVIASILPCVHDHDGAPNERATHTLAEELSVEADRIDRTIADLVRSREVLTEVMESARIDGEVPQGLSPRTGPGSSQPRQAHTVPVLVPRPPARRTVPHPRAAVPAHGLITVAYTCFAVGSLLLWPGVVGAHVDPRPGNDEGDTAADIDHRHRGARGRVAASGHPAAAKQPAPQPPGMDMDGRHRGRARHGRVVRPERMTKPTDSAD